MPEIELVDFKIGEDSLLHLLLPEAFPMLGCSRMQQLSMSSQQWQLQAEETPDLEHEGASGPPG